MLKPCATSQFSQLICSLLVLFHIFSGIANSKSVVKFLPGFEGPLPFYLETGYVGVGESEEVQLFYYFIKSEGNPKEDPLLLWLNGGPGCSVLSAIVYEIGPLYFKITKYNGSLPTFVLNPYSWTKRSNIIFLDSPVGTGFSYAKNLAASYSSDTDQIHHVSEFFRKWLNDHPEFLRNAVYIGGESYTGFIVPGVVQELSNGAEGIKPTGNLEGYILGNAAADPHLEINSRIPFAHGMGLISDELYESLERNCNGEYDRIDPRNADCLKDMELFKKCTSGINFYCILEPLCASDSPKPQVTSGNRRSLSSISNYLFTEDPSIPEFGCRTYAYLLSNYWANDDDVQKALHIRKGSIEFWQRCSQLPYYTRDVKETFHVHVNLSTKGYRSLVFSGDHDMMVPFLGTQAWVRNLNYTIVDDWRPWMLQGQVAGYTRTYSNQMTFATIKGAGHTSPEYKPKECFTMFERWTRHEIL